MKIMEEAEQLDPLSPVVLHTLGNMYVFVGKYDDSIRQSDKLLEMDPQMRIALEAKAWSTGLKGDWDTALKLFEEVHRLTGHPLKGLMGLSFAYAKVGNNEKALDCIHKMEQRQQEEPDSVIDPDLAAAWFGLGDLDKTFYYLNRCIDRRMGPINYFLEYPAYEGIKNDHRYITLVRRIKEE